MYALCKAATASFEGGPFVSANSESVDSSGTRGHTVYMLSYRYYGEVIGTAVREFHTYMGGDINNDEGSIKRKIPVKTNSRTPDSQSAYGTSTGPTTPPLAMAFALHDASHTGMIFYRRITPIATSGSALGTAPDLTDATAPNNCGVFSETGRDIESKRIKKRITKNGYAAFIPGSIMHFHKKTGGGAFEFHAPHFDNDTILTDTSAWKLGHVQSEVWNINLFGLTPSQLPVMSMGT